MDCLEFLRQYLRIIFLCSCGESNLRSVDLLNAGYNSVMFSWTKIFLRFWLVCISIIIVYDQNVVYYYLFVLTFFVIKYCLWLCSLCPSENYPISCVVTGIYQILDPLIYFCLLYVFSYLIRKFVLHLILYLMLFLSNFVFINDCGWMVMYFKESFWCIFNNDVVITSKLYLYIGDICC